MLLRIEVFSFVEFLELRISAFVFHPFLVLSDAPKEEAILVLLFTVLDHLDELMSHSVSDSLQELALLPAKDWHGVLGQSQQNSLVAETLVSKVFEICVFFQFYELVHIILVERVRGL